MRMSLPVVLRNVPRVHILAAFLFFSCLYHVATPPISSLYTSFFSSVLLWIYGICRAGHGFGERSTTRRAKCWTAGALLTLGQLCQRAGGDVGALWWSNSLLPIIIVIGRQVQAGSDHASDSFGITSVRSRSISIRPDNARSTRLSPSDLPLLYIASAATLVVLANPYISTTNTALGLCSVSVVGLSYILLEEAVRLSPKTPDERNGAFVAANGSLLRRASLNMPDQDSVVMCMRDCSVSFAVCNLIIAFVLGVLRWDLVLATSQSQLPWHPIICFIIISGIGFGRLFFVMSAVAQHGSYDTALIHLMALILAQMLAKPTLEICVSGLITILPTLCASTQLLVEAFGPSARHAIRPRRLIMAVGVFFVAGSIIVHAIPGTRVSTRSGEHIHDLQQVEPTSPHQFALSGVHPIKYLMDNAETQFAELRSRQSRTLAEAVAEYGRRYQLPPPPGFDRWFEFAAKRGVQLIDEFDTIHDSFLPFWALKPSTIRTRVTEALGFENNGLIALLIRDGRAIKIQGGPDWQRSALVGMIKEFVHFLPDMDIAFNVHDEPRIVVPHDELTRMVNVAVKEAIPTVLANSNLRNSFSERPEDMSSGKIIKEAKVSRFNEYAHQNTWGPCRLSCSPDSASRAIEDNVSDNYTSYALGELGFIYNHTAFSDICNSPSFRRSYGFFDRPNAFKISHELIPIFSQSKISSFQDILYPSPWYWSGTVSTDDLGMSHMKAQVEYMKNKDMPWSQKEDKFWWRGSTTGGFSRAGGWRRQHRQIFVAHINALDDAKIMIHQGIDSTPAWKVGETHRQTYSNLMDIRFSGVGQCDPGDCDAQKEFFSLAGGVDMQEAWRYKYLLDIDGNAFSGRFYAFLQSNSLVYKVAIFREWHQEWLKPWLHYIPLSLKGGEHVEGVRYFAEEAEGQEQGPKLAQAGQDWANKALRSVDFEVWMFRLLLEYGRIIDDKRDSIGFTIA